MLVMAVVAVAIGAFGPIYLHSTDQAVLNSALANAPSENLGLTLQPAHRVGGFHKLEAAADHLPRPGGGRPWFGKAISTEEVGFTSTADGQAFFSGLTERSGVCAHLVMVAGQCSSQFGTVVISTRSARELGLGVGQTLHLSLTDSSRTASLKITGLCTPNPASPYWWGTNYFGYGTGSPSKPVLDNAFTTMNTIDAMAPASLVSTMIQVPFHPRSLAVDSTSDFESRLGRYKTSVLADNGVVASTQLPHVLALASADEHTSNSIVLVVDFELLLLAVFALYFVASRTAWERQDDIYLAVLRGYRPRSTLSVALAEPIVIVLIAVPVGLLLAWTVAVTAVTGLFGPGVGASVTLLALGGALVSGVFGILAVGLGARRVLGAADVGEAPGGPSPRSSTWRLVGDVAAIVIAGAAFVELAVTGVSQTSDGTRADPLSAFAPALLALALGVTAARLLPALLRSARRITRSRSVAWVLATRRVARRPEFASEIVLVAMCTALAVFGVSGWAMNARNHAVRNSFAVGATKVLTVSVRPGVRFLPAVRSADRFGHSAMAAVVERAPDGTTLAVDTRDMAEVMSWPSGLGAGGPARVAHRLVPRGLSPPVVVTGTALRMTVTARVSAQPSPQLSIFLFDEGFHTAHQIVLGTLTTGTTTYEAQVPGLCPATCQLRDIAITWNPALSASIKTGTADVTIASFSELHGATWAPVHAGLRIVRRWANPTGGAHLSTSPAGLTAVVDLNPDGVPVEVAPDDVPRFLPTVLPTTAAAFGWTPGSPPPIVGLDGGTLSGLAVGQVPALPGIGTNAELVDLEMAQRLLAGPFAYATTEVWLSSSAPADIVSRLRASGISVVGVDSVKARERASIHSGVNLAYTLFLIAGIAAAILAIGTASFAMSASARARDAELAAMRAIGIPPQSLRRSVEAEQALALGAGVLFGTSAGLGAAAVALRSVPEFLRLAPGPPLNLGLPAVLLAVGLATTLVVLSLVVQLSSSVLVRRASIEKLGGSQK
jgi:putative ABC transport system permease protein